MPMTRTRRIAAETVGTAVLLAAVVGSGIMGERLAGGNVAIALLANTLATGATLAITKRSPNVATNSLKSCAIPLRMCCEV